nr:YesL family protein [uncultured Oscillibacter sp.]
MFFQSDDSDLMPPEVEDGGEAPEKTGFARVLELVSGQCGALLKANLLFLLGCIPVVTIPLSLYAMNRVMLRVVRDQPVKCLREYWEAFRRDWKRGYLAFLLTAAPLGLAGCGMWFYLSRAALNLLFFLPFLVCSTVFLMTLLSSGYLYGRLDSGKKGKEAVGLALVLGVARPLRSIPAALCCYGLPLLAVLLFPLSGLYLLLLGFSLPCLLGNFFLRTLLKPYME